jgi:hypothetical protein
VVADKCGISAERAERTMTMQRIELEWFWLQRAEARRQRVDEGAILGALGKAFSGNA